MGGAPDCVLENTKNDGMSPLLVNIVPGPCSEVTQELGPDGKRSSLNPPHFGVEVTWSSEPASSQTPKLVFVI